MGGVFPANEEKAEMQMLEEIAAARTEECEKLQQSVKLLQVCVLRGCGCVWVWVCL